MSRLQTPIRKNDTVLVTTGKDRGAHGRVLRVLASDGKAIVERVNMIKRHTKPRPAPRNSTNQQVIPGGVIEKEAPLNLSNVQLVCPECGKPTRIGFSWANRTELVTGSDAREPLSRAIAGDLPAAQSQQENDRLSTARALTVFAELRRVQPALDLLRNNDGQPLLGVSGYGERRPLPDALGASETDFAQNRRIDLRFILSSRTSDEVRRLIDEIDRLRREPETTDGPAAPETP
jgi:ribosomal protein L24